MTKKEYTNQELAKIYLKNEMKLQRLENEVAQLKKIINKRLAKQRLKKKAVILIKK